MVGWAAAVSGDSAFALSAVAVLTGRARAFDTPGGSGCVVRLAHAKTPRIAIVTLRLEKICKTPNATSGERR